MAWLVPLIPLTAAVFLATAGRGPGDGAPDGKAHRSRATGTGSGTKALRRTLAWIASVSMAVTAVAAAVAAARGWTGEIPWSSQLGLRLDFSHAAAPFVGVFAVLVPAVAAPVLVYAARHERSEGLNRLLAVLALFVGAMEVVAGAADLLTLLLGWELIGACSALLVAQEWTDPEKPRAAVVVFLTTRTGDLGLFLAAAVAFTGVGSLRYGALGDLTGLSLHLFAGGVLAAAAAKSAQLPFAPWLFAAMKGPVSVSALLHSATMVAAGAFLLIRLHPVLDAVAWFGTAAMTIGLATALAGGVVALLQPHAKRLLAGSTSAHYGFMFVAAGAGYPAVAAVHLVAHAVSKAPLFLVTGIAHGRAGSYRLHRMKLGSSLPAVAVAGAMAAAAIAGLPPLGAGWSKEKVVAAAGHHGPWLAVLVSVAGGLSAAYMARWYFQTFGRGRGGLVGRRPGASERWPVFILTGAAVLAGSLWIPAAHEAAGRFLAGGIASGAAWELALSLTLIGAGAVAGRAVAERRPALGEAGATREVADWLALPALGRLVVGGGRRFATLLAAFDERVVDGAIDAAAAAGRSVSGAAALLDDRVVDGAVRTAATAGRSVSGATALLDDRIVDGAVRLLAALGRGLATLGSRLLESVLDAVPEGSSRLVGRGGSGARRMQDGLAHHYYRLIVAGLAAVIVLLILGG